ncbi:hypothetical protein PHLCEN_2v3276 [Hermanssonia centrifuga]|uniref:Uncharacterized protein n=1 Tax=Hermanssonia centrifuga TaxID=98765 RepID=A0A2R6QUH2_9APHY|nr:hypothetical protein PHLCEN_2v3276 [Hermanssonia centrifuga]
MDSSRKPKGKKGSKRGQSCRKIEDLSDAPMPSSMPQPTVKIENKMLLRAALKSAADSGTFIDTKFYAFSRRDPSRTAYEPKAVYANGWLLRARLPSYFEPLLAGGYKESAVGSLHGNFPSNHQAYNIEYGYDSDSDLEDDEDSDDGDGVTLKTDREEEYMTDEIPQPEKDVGDKTEAISEELLKEHGAYGTGRVVILRDFAYPTWKALIFYLCTGEVAFAALQSQKKENIPAGQISPDAPLCSPKSMYRIADQLGLDALRNLAEKDILSKLSADNIMEELFSEFTSLYDKIRDMETQFACDNALTRTSANISECIERMATGQRPYNAVILKCLFQRFFGALEEARSSKPGPMYCSSPNCRNTAVGGSGSSSKAKLTTLACASCLGTVGYSL